MEAIKERNIGEILCEQGVITPQQLSQALQKQKQQGVILREVLQKDYKVSEESLAQAVAEQLDIPYLGVEAIEPEPEVLDKIPSSVARQYKVLPLKQKGDRLLVAMADPQNILLLDELAIRTRAKIVPVVSASQAILSAISRCYKGGEVEGAMEAVVEKYKPEVKEIKIEGEISEGSAPIIKLANSVIEEAYRKKASDIHIEPREKGALVRYRIDGMLQEAVHVPEQAKSPLVARYKIMTNLDIAEHRKPQDGRIGFKKFNKNVDIDLRVSTAPMADGEKVVMRILDKKSTMVGIEGLGFSEENLAKFREAITKPYGMILLVGPTGSGKTTTLYAALTGINKPDVNILTAEDPIEYRLKGINQLQVRASIGLTFANTLRSFLRQDPDIIMVGEIRDLETALIAIEAALTGHLLFSTLHTNNAPATVTRLTEMGIDPFLIADSLLCVVAQRLARRICSNCKAPYTPSEEKLRRLGLDPAAGSQLYKGEGCAECNYTGYKGRLGIHELLVMSGELRELILNKAPVTQLRETAIKSGMKTLFQDGIEKMLAGYTTPEEVLRVTMEE